MSKVYVVTVAYENCMDDMLGYTKVIGVYKNLPSLEVIGRKWVNDNLSSEISWRLQPGVTSVAFDGFVDGDYSNESVSLVAEPFEVH